MSKEQTEPTHIIDTVETFEPLSPDEQAKAYDDWLASQRSTLPAKGQTTPKG